MKNNLMVLHNKISLRGRSVIESINDDSKKLRETEFKILPTDTFIINLIAASGVHSFFSNIF